MGVTRGMPVQLADGDLTQSAKNYGRSTSACLGSLLSVDFVVTQFGDESGLFVDLCSQVRVLLPFVGCVVGRLQQLHHLSLLILLRS